MMIKLEQNSQDTATAQPATREMTRRERRMYLKLRQKQQVKQKTQIQQNNDRIIRRLIDAGIFPDKTVAIQAALTTLLAGLAEIGKSQNVDSSAGPGSAPEEAK